jgi:hypothetical protein
MPLRINEAFRQGSNLHLRWFLVFEWKASEESLSFQAYVHDRYGPLIRSAPSLSTPCLLCVDWNQWRPFRYRTPRAALCLEWTWMLVACPPWLHRQSANVARNTTDYLRSSLRDIHRNSDDAVILNHSACILASATRQMSQQRFRKDHWPAQLGWNPPRPILFLYTIRMLFCTKRKTKNEIKLNPKP